MSIELSLSETDKVLLTGVINRWLAKNRPLKTQQVLKVYFTIEEDTLIKSNEPNAENHLDLIEDPFKYDRLLAAPVENFQFDQPTHNAGTRIRHMFKNA